MKYLLPLLLIMSLVSTVFAQETEEQELQEESKAIELQVVASKIQKRISDTSANVTVITEEELKSKSGSSVTDVLRENGIAALDTVGERRQTDKVYIQGMDSERLLIVIDGQRVRDGGAMGGISALKRIPLSSIVRIEIIKGPSSFLWGSDAQAGVIYIETKKGAGLDGFHGDIGASYKNNFHLEEDNHFTRPYANFSYGWGGNNSVWAGGSFEYANVWLSPYTIGYIPTPEYPDGVKVENIRDKYTMFDVYGGIKFDFLDINTLEMSVRYQEEEPVGELDVEDYMFRKIMANIIYNVYPLDNLDISISTGIAYDFERWSALNQDIEDYYIFSDSEIFFAYYLNDIFTLKGGYNLDIEFYNELNINRLYSQQNHAIFFGGDADIDSVVDVDITAGVRYQLNIRNASGFSNTSPLHSVSPEVGIVLKPIDMLTIKGHVGHSFKVPDLSTAFRDYFNHGWFYVGPNPELEPESSWGYSGTLEIYPLDNMAISAGIFRNDLKNLIDYQETGEFFNGLPLRLPVNIASAYTWGVNAGTTASFEIKYFGILSYSFNFEYVWARQSLPEEEQYIDYDTGQRFNPRLEDRPEYTLSGSISWYKEKWGTTLKLSGFYFAQGYKYQEVGANTGIYAEIKTPQYSSLDIRISQEIPPFSVYDKIENVVYFEVKNLLNSIYDDDGDGDTDRPERHFILGFDMSF